jgi:hypothetical protein
MTTYDVDAVVALTVAALSTTSSSEIAELRSQNINLENLKNGAHPTLNERTKAILHVIAEVSVNDKEVVAIGLRIRRVQNENPVPELLIAINDEMLSGKIIEHIKTCWQILRKISKNHVSNYQNSNPNEVSPKTIPETSSSFMNSLYIDLFKNFILTVIRRCKEDLRNTEKYLTNFE